MLVLPFVPVTPTSVSSLARIAEEARRDRRERAARVGHDHRGGRQRDRSGARLDEQRRGAELERRARDRRGRRRSRRAARRTASPGATARESLTMPRITGSAGGSARAGASSGGSAASSAESRIIEPSRRAEAHAHGAAAHDRAGRRLLRDRAAAAADLAHDAEAGRARGAPGPGREAAKVGQEHAVAESVTRAAHAAASLARWRRSRLAAWPGCAARSAASRTRCARDARAIAVFGAGVGCARAARASRPSTAGPSRRARHSGGAPRARSGCRGARAARRDAREERRRGGAAGVHEAARLVQLASDHEARRVGGRHADEPRAGSDGCE